MPPQRRAAGRPPKKSKNVPSKSICLHCNRKLNDKTIRAHLEGSSRPQIEIPNSLRHAPVFNIDFDESDGEPALDIDIPSSESDENPDGGPDIDVDRQSVIGPAPGGGAFDEYQLAESANMVGVMGVGLQEELGTINTPSQVPEPAPEPRFFMPRTVTIEDVPEDEDEEATEHDRALDEQHGIYWMQDMDELDYAEAGLDGLTLDDIVDENMEQELADFVRGFPLHIDMNDLCSIKLI